MKKVVLAYSGGLDTSVIPSWLKDTYDCPVIAYAADLGQDEDIEGLKQRALEAGADEAVAEDLREEFVRDFANSISTPLITRSTE